MNGANETKELASREIKMIDSMMDKWIDLMNQNNSTELGQMTENLQNKFKHNKALISVLKAINDDESTRLYRVMEAQNQHFSDLLNSKPNYHRNEYSLPPQFNENSQLINDLKTTTKEIDKTLESQIVSLETMSTQAYENNIIMNKLVPRVRKADKDVTELFLLLFIAVILMFIISYLYSHRK